MAERRDTQSTGNGTPVASEATDTFERDARQLFFSASLRSSRVCFKLSKDDAPLVRAYEAVLPLHGFAVVSSPSEADVVVTNSLQIAQGMLAAGHRVIHLSSEGARSQFERPSAGLKSHPDYGSRYHCVEPLQLLSLYSELSKIERRDEVDTEQRNTALDLDSVLIKTSLTGLNILVVDNNELNRASATFQLSEGNNLSVCETYKEAVDLLKSKPFDVALLDLLMPPESFTLSGAAFERVIGSEFPAGIFTALVAARAGVKNIRIITDASHHDHPATALIDYISWGAEIPCGDASRITFEKARTVQIPRSTGRVNDSVKDWASTLEGQSLFGMERNCATKK